MTNRRTFLTRSALSMLTMPFAQVAMASAERLKLNLGNENRSPLMLSTWDFGKAANEDGMKILLKGGKALDAVEQAAWVPESDPDNQSVGYGGLPDRDGRVTLDACIMDEQGNCGGVACIEFIKHPISVARKVMEDTPHVLLVGDGALQFALSKGFKKENLLTDKSRADWEKWKIKAKYEPVINSERHDTIGILALDSHGNMSGACTTSGLAYKMHGRVGDSPLIGDGLFVDDEVGGAASTGLGEAVMKTCGSFLVVEFMRQGMHPQMACEEAVKRVIKKNPQTYKSLQVGFIAMNKKGQTGAFSIQKGFNYAFTGADFSKVIDSGYSIK